MKHILVVDDERRIAEIARDYLERAGYRVTIAGNGTDALTLARSQRLDLIVLDLGLPHMDGLDVTRTLRKHSNVPIIMLTARVDESDKLVGLELGADDYVTKPFSPKELVARVRAVFRRIDVAPERGDIVRVGEVTLDKPRMQVTLGDHAVDLTATEFELLATLARQPGRVFSRTRSPISPHSYATPSARSPPKLPRAELSSTSMRPICRRFQSILCGYEKC
jgi:two-component system, OmpR family, alkaline phosphatase synthesis response regulator PhoP